MLAYLEHKFGRFAIPHLIPGIVFLNTVTFALLFFEPSFINYLTLNPDLIRQGQLWRLFTYVFIPPNVHPIFIIFALLFLWTMGNGLGEAWGAFRLNLYFLLGLIMTSLTAFILGWVDASGFFVYSSLFFAFATFYPNYQILLFFIIPIKIKWLALFSLVTLVFLFINSSLIAKMALLAGHANYILFFGKNLIQNNLQRRQTFLRKRKFEKEVLPDNNPIFHQCAICQKNDLTDPQLLFRVASDGKEYCQDHLPKPVLK